MEDEYEVKNLWKQDIKKREGYRDRPYALGDGVITVGYGFTKLTGHPEIKRAIDNDMVISEGDAERWLEDLYDSTKRSAKGYYGDFDSLPTQAKVDFMSTIYNRGMNNILKREKSGDLPPMSAYLDQYKVSKEAGDAAMAEYYRNLGKWEYSHNDHTDSGGKNLGRGVAKRYYSVARNYDDSIDPDTELGYDEFEQGKEAGDIKPEFIRLTEPWNYDEEEPQQEEDVNPRQQEQPWHLDLNFGGKKEDEGQQQVYNPLEGLSGNQYMRRPLRQFAQQEIGVPEYGNDYSYSDIGNTVLEDEEAGYGSYGNAPSVDERRVFNAEREAELQAEYEQYMRERNMPTSNTYAYGGEVPYANDRLRGLNPNGNSYMDMFGYEKNYYPGGGRVNNRRGSGVGDVLSRIQTRLDIEAAEAKFDVYK